MSERKVLGWAVKRNSRHFWLKVAFENGGVWDTKSNRAVFATCDKARAAKAAVATCNTGVTVVRIVAKPKAPKPDKLEQAIAKLRDSQAYNRRRLDEVRRRGEGAHLVRFWEGCLTESTLAIKAAEGFL